MTGPRENLISLSKNVIDTHVIGFLVGRSLPGLLHTEDTRRNYKAHEHLRNNTIM